MSVSTARSPSRRAALGSQYAGGAADAAPTTRPIRVAVTYRVCQAWRAPIFARLAATPEIELLVLHGQSLPGTKLANTPDFTGIPHRELRTWRVALRSSGREATVVVHPGITRALARFHPDVILCEGGSNFANNLLIYPWAALHGSATIWWSLGELPGRRFHGAGLVYKRVCRWMMRRSTALLGYSSRARAHFLAEGCRQPTYVAVNCVDTDRVFARIAAYGSRPSEVRQRLGFEGKRVMLFVGALTRVKRVDDLLRAYARVRAENGNTALVIVGDGPMRKELQDLAASMQLADVHFAGEVVEGVTDYFLSADLFVLPGLGGLAVSEAMAHGLPVVCTVGDGCESDLIEDGVSGRILPEGDLDRLAHTMLELASEPERLRRMGQAAQATIREHHNVGTYMENVTAAIRCAYENRPGTRPAAPDRQRETWA